MELFERYTDLSQAIIDYHNYRQSPVIGSIYLYECNTGLDVHYYITTSLFKMHYGLHHSDYILIEDHTIANTDGKKWDKEINEKYGIYAGGKIV